MKKLLFATIAVFPAIAQAEEVQNYYLKLYGIPLHCKKTFGIYHASIVDTEQCKNLCEQNNQEYKDTACEVGIGYSNVKCSCKKKTPQ